MTTITGPDGTPHDALFTTPADLPALGPRLVKRAQPVATYSLTVGASVDTARLFGSTPPRVYFVDGRDWYRLLSKDVAFVDDTLTMSGTVRYRLTFGQRLLMRAGQHIGQRRRGSNGWR